MGSNLYIQNPWGDATDFCIDSVVINGALYAYELDLSTFEIKLDSLGFELDDPITLSIYHKSGCKPKILNQNHHYQRSTLVISDFKVEGDTVQWTGNERIPGRFEIQIYRWNKWITINSIAKRIQDTVFQITLNNDFHSGENKMRIRFFNVRNQSFYSKEIKYNPGLEEVNYSIDKKSNMLMFSSITRFEVFDRYGLMIYKGKSDHINLDDFPNKTYYLNFDNQNVELKLKRY